MKKVKISNTIDNHDRTIYLQNIDSVTQVVESHENIKHGSYT